MTTAAPTKSRKKGKKNKIENVIGSPALKAAVAAVAEQFGDAAAAAGLKPADLAKKMGVTESRVRQILDGRVISLRIIIDVCNALGVKFCGLVLK